MGPNKIQKTLLPHSHSLPSNPTMRRATISFLNLLRSSQTTPLLPKPHLYFPKCPYFPRPFQTLSHSTPPRQPRTAKYLEESFESATTTTEILSTFKTLENSLNPNDFKLGIAALKVAQHLESIQSDDHDQTLEYALKALKIFDRPENRDKNAILIAMALHLVGSVTYELKRFNESLSFLNRAKRILNSVENDGEIIDFDVRMIAHAVHLQLANTKTALGRREEAIVNLKECLGIKEEIFEGNSKELGVGYRDLGEAYAAILNFKEALPLCKKALEIHMSQLGINSVEVAHDRRLLGVIYTGLEEHEKALEQNELSQKVLKSWGLGSDLLHAEIDAANIQIALGKYDEAIEMLKKVVEQADKDSETKALVFVSMAKALCNQEKVLDAKRCLEMSCEIFDNNEEESSLKVAEAYTEISMLYESMNEFETAISLLKKSLAIVEREPQEHHMEGNISARIGWLLLLNGKVEQAIGYLESAVERMKESFGPKHFGVGYIYNNLGAAYMEMERPQTAAQMFALAKNVMDVALGPHHADSIQSCQSLANAYDAMGSYPLALEFQQQVIDAWRNHGPSAEDELKEATRIFEELKKKAFESFSQDLSLPQKDYTTTISAMQN